MIDEGSEEDARCRTPYRSTDCAQRPRRGVSLILEIGMAHVRIGASLTGTGKEHQLAWQVRRYACTFCFPHATNEHRLRHRYTHWNTHTTSATHAPPSPFYFLPHSLLRHGQCCRCSRCQLTYVHDQSSRKTGVGLLRRPQCPAAYCVLLEHNDENGRTKNAPPTSKALQSNHIHDTMM